MSVAIAAYLVDGLGGDNHSANAYTEAMLKASCTAQRNITDFQPRILPAQPPMQQSQINKFNIYKPRNYEDELKNGGDKMSDLTDISWLYK
jgi:hypothetical protein